MYSEPLAIFILLGFFVFLLVLRVPITLALIFSSIVTSMYIQMPLTAVIQKMVTGIENFSLLAIPFFIVAGQIMSEGGITKRIIDFSNVIIGRHRGGLAQINVLASMFFGGVSGSAVADVSSIGVMLIPMMKRKGYDTDFSVAVTVTSACQGIIIPPSHNMIIFAFAAGGVSVGRLFLGGMIPGIILGLGLMTLCAVISIKRNYPQEDPYTLKEAIKIALDSSLGLFTFVIIMGGVSSGLFTATESAAIAVIYAFIIAAFVYKELNFTKIQQIFYGSLKTLAMVMALIAAASAYGYLLAILKVPAKATTLLLGLTENKYLLLLLINVMLLLLGCIMDMAPLILIVTPILYPVMVNQIGMDPVHFGVMLILNLAIGLCTPPVGGALFVGCAIGEIPIEKETKALLPFYFIMIAVLILITFFPIFSTFFPDLIMPNLVAK